MAKQKKSRHTGRKIAIVVIILALVGAAVLIGPIILGRRMAANAVNIKKVAAITGTIAKTATGTGNVTAEDTIEDVLVPVGVKIDQVMVESGDKVKTGEILATLDATALQQQIWDSQAGLDELDARLNQIKNDTESVYVRSTLSGRIKQVFAGAGDDVAAVMREHGALMILSGDGKMVVRFEPLLAEGLAAGDTVTVVLADGTEKDGEIRQATADRCEVTLSDYGPVTGETVEVLLPDGTKLGQGALEISRTLVVTGTDGTIRDVLRDVDTRVQSGTNLFKLEQAPESREAIRLYAERADKAEELNRLIICSQSPVIAAPSDGTVVSVLVAEGQAVTETSAGQATALTLKTASQMQLKVDIDELDVASLAIGQSATIALDALPDLDIIGTISEIAETGKVSQSGATFAVTLELVVANASGTAGDSAADGQALKAGMSATAEITIARREQIVTLPLEALQESGKEQFVYVGTAVNETNLGEKRLVVTGISDGTTVEILDGLQAGETVNYRFVTGNESLLPFGNGNFRNRANDSQSQTQPGA